jgi:hypothetical protein
MMKNEKMPLLQKFLASLFALMFVASLVFMGWRIIHKKDYVEHEREQCRLLAVSAAASLADWNGAVPDMWSRIASGDSIIIIDHRLIQDNWSITAARKRAGGLTVKVSSGWNSRSPQEYVCRGRIAGGGFVFDQESDQRTAETLRAVNPSPHDKVLPFAYPDERLTMPVKLLVAVTPCKLDGKDYIILKKR